PALELDKAREFTRRVRPPHAVLTLIAERVDVDPIRKRLHGRAVGPSSGDALAILRRIKPVRSATKLDERPAVAERAIVIRDVGDRAPVRLEAAVRYAGPVGIGRASGNTARQEGVDRGVAELGQVVPFRVTAVPMAVRVVAHGLGLHIAHAPDALGGGSAE